LARRSAKNRVRKVHAPDPCAQVSLG
jgi:hypothetical protein